MTLAYLYALYIELEVCYGHMDFHWEKMPGNQP